MPPRLAPDSTFQAGWRKGGLERAGRRDLMNGVVTLIMASKQGGIVFDLARIHPDIDTDDLVAARERAAEAIAFVEDVVMRGARSASGLDRAAAKAEVRERFPDLSETTFIEIFGYAAVRDR